MKCSEYYRIADLFVYIADSLFAGNSEIQKHLLPFRISCTEMNGTITKSAEFPADRAATELSSLANPEKASSLTNQEEFSSPANPEKLYTLTNQEKASSLTNQEGSSTLTTSEKLFAPTLNSSDIAILDQRGAENSRFIFEEGNVLYEEDYCSTPTKFCIMPDGSYGCQLSDGEGEKIFVFHISADWSAIALTYSAMQDNGGLLFTKLAPLFAISLLSKDACVFHGVAMKYREKGILVMAPSGVGKSTHTNRWESMGFAEIINGDRCLCRKTNGKWYVYGMPWAGSSGKHLQTRVTIDWIIDLKRGKENTIENLSPFKQEIFLLQRMFAPVTPSDQQEKAFTFAHEIASSSIVKRLYCLPDEESVLLLKAYVDEALPDFPI